MQAQISPGSGDLEFTELRPHREILCATSKKIKNGSHIKTISFTIWLFNITMENPHF